MSSRQHKSSARGPLQPETERFRPDRFGEQRDLRERVDRGRWRRNISSGEDVSHHIRGIRAPSGGGGRGEFARAAAGRFGVSVSTAIRWAQLWRAEGHAQAQARAMGGDHRSRLVEHRTAVVKLVARQPDLTLLEIRGGLAAAHGVSVGLTRLWRLLKAQQIKLKKRACTPPSKTAPM